MSKLLKDFSAFVREQGVVGLAVGLAVGTSAGQAVAALVDQFISPLVGIILQGTDLSGIKSDVEVGDASVTFGWGIIIQAVITLLATAFVIYFIVDKAGLTKADKKK
jgi:large conductance mechanosensitive channel protein